MKATGVVRRVDSLGRIVIPKEIRSTLRIGNDVPLAIFTGSDGEIIFKKYMPFDDLSVFATDYAESLSRTTGHITCIVDKDRIIAAAGAHKKTFQNKTISSALDRAIMRRKAVMASRSDAAFVPMLDDDEDEELRKLYNNEFIAPIVAGIDAVGAVILLSQDKEMGEVENVLATTAAEFLAKQVEYQD